MPWRSLLISFKLLLLTAVVGLVLAPETPAFASEPYRLDTLVGRQRFDYVSWWLRAATAKLGADLADGQSYLDEAARRQVALDYLRLAGEARRLEREIERIFSDPAHAGAPESAVAASAPQQAELARVRGELARRQAVAEAVLEEQVATVLVDEGFGVLGTAWPPVKMRMSPLPRLLVVSPREEIRQIYSLSLTPGLPVPEQEALEDSVARTLDRSALVESIVGVGLYPAMLLELSDINTVANTIAHEWAHHWLTLHPLGIRYYATPGLRTINETVASIVGNEIGPKVVARYYPELLRPPPARPAPATGSPGEAAEPPPFDLRAALAETRVTVDRLLAEGRIEEAEAYMEERRLLIVAEGYGIRKINQAFFAFRGAYADAPGATGDDPIGPALTALRAGSGSLRDFLDAVAGITSEAELLSLADARSP